MPNTIDKPREYTLERLQELRVEADVVGDTDSRDKLAAMIVARGGIVPNSEIPADETKMGRLERLRQDALAVRDTDSAEKLAEMIAKAQGVKLPYLPNLDPLFQAKQSLDDAIVVDEDTPEELAELRKAYEVLRVSYEENGPSPANPPPDWVTGELYVAADALRDAILANEPFEVLVELRKTYETILEGDMREDTEESVVPQEGRNLVRKDAPRMTHDEILQDFLEEAAVRAYHDGEPEDLVKAIRKGESAADKWLSSGVLAMLIERRAKQAAAVSDAETNPALHTEEFKDEVIEVFAPHGGKNLVDEPPLNGGMGVHVPSGEHATRDPVAVAEENKHIAENIMARSSPQDAPESDEERSEGPEATQKVNNGTASVNATARIKREGWRLDEIPARFGAKVDMIDVRNYAKMLTRV